MLLVIKNFIMNVALLGSSSSSSRLVVVMMHGDGVMAAWRGVGLRAVAACCARIFYNSFICYFMMMASLSLFYLCSFFL